jgi:uncharacterized protein
LPSLRIALACAVAVLALPGRAQQAPPASPVVETFALKSAVYGGERRVVVRVPPTYRHDGRRYPVLYLTDGSRNLPLLAQTVAFLAANGRMPEMIVVGIDPVRRDEELTFSKGTVEGEGVPAQRPTGGDAARFLSFLEKEVIPWTEKTYRTEPYRVLHGHSFGGLFALYTLWARPELFRARLVIAPTLTWNGDEPVRRVKELVAARQDLAGAVVFILGDEGDAQAAQFEALKGALAVAAPALRATGLRFPGEDHGTILFDGNYRGLQAVFDGWRMPVAAGGIGPRGGAAAVEAHFAKLGERLGWKGLRAPEVALNLAGYQQLRDGDLTAAIVTLQRSAALYPESANAHDSLGEAFERAGQLGDAKREYQTAWIAGDEAHDPNTPVYKHNYDRVAGAVKTGVGVMP